MAARLFAKLGLDKCSTREIAKESNSNISLISYYFGGKEGLYKQVLREFALEIRDHVKSRSLEGQNLPMSKDFFTKEVLATIDSMIFFRTKYPEVCQIFAREKLIGLKHSKEIHEEIFYPLTQNFFKLVADAQKAKIVKAEINPALFFILISEGVWGLYQLKDCPSPVLKSQGDLFKDKKKLSQQIVQIFIEGAMR